MSFKDSAKIQITLDKLFGERNDTDVESTNCMQRGAICLLRIEYYL